MFGRLGKLAAHHAGKVLVVMGIFAGLSLWFGPQVLKSLDTGGFTSESSESSKVIKAIEQDFNKEQSALIILFKSKDGLTARDPQYREAVDKILADAKKQEPAITDVKTFYNTGAEQFISKDKKSTFALVSLQASEVEQGKIGARLREKLQNDKLHLAYGGEAITTHDVTEQIAKDLGVAEAVSFSILAVLLVFVFRSVAAALLPLLLGVFTIVGSMLVLRLLSQVTTIVEYALNVIILVGLGLAIDYSLLIISRFREELANHKGDVTEALLVTMQTAGRTVFFSGLTVVICLLSLFVFPLALLQSIAMGGAAAVGISMVAALIVLPAILRVLGYRINWLSFGNVKRSQQAALKGKRVKEKESIWHKAGGFVMGHAVSTMLITLGILIAAGLPFLHAKLSTPDHRVLPPDSPARQVSEALQNDFTFDASPIQIVFKTSDWITSPESIGKLYDYTRALQKLGGVDSVESIVNLPQNMSREEYQLAYANLEQQPQLKAAATSQINGTQTIIRVNQTYDTQSKEAQQLVAQIRNLQKPEGVTAQVGGMTAGLVDLLQVISAYFPYAVAIIVVTLLVLLFLMLGSVVIPIVAMLQNVLSLGAAFGAVVWVFQEYNLVEFFRFNASGDIFATQPVLIFAIAFGLSMDYSVFLYSRIKEQYEKTKDTDKAVLAGLQKTGSIITSAAMLLFVVVAAFATSDISIMEQIGFGLALAILVDAFIVRMLLVPATMRLLGKYSWWAPKPLLRLQAKIGLKEG